MGSGKTSAMINYINESSQEEKFIFVTPYLLEVERVIESCPQKKFKEPMEKGGKLNNVKLLISKGYNIATTHALFNLFDEEVRFLLEDSNYTLIMDEAIQVIETLKITYSDMQNILKSYALIDKEGVVRWHCSDYEGKLSGYKKLCQAGRIYKSGSGLLDVFQVSIFEAFKKVYVLTYMFEGQILKYYFDFFNVKYSFLSVSNANGYYHLTSDKVDYVVPNYKKLIHIYEKRNRDDMRRKLNDIGKGKNALSVSWYENKKNKKNIERLQKNCVCFFRKYANTKVKYNMWTTYSEYKKNISGGGYATGFVSCNMRASNDYKHKTSCAYLVNRFISPVHKNFFATRGIKVDEDAFATSEMLQWLFRSAIREGKEITVYVPSERMRRLLKKWIRSVS